MCHGITLGFLMRYRPSGEAVCRPLAWKKLINSLASSMNFGWMWLLAQVGWCQLKSSERITLAGFGSSRRTVDIVFWIAARGLPDFRC